MTSKPKSANEWQERLNDLGRQLGAVRTQVRDLDHELDHASFGAATGNNEAARTVSVASTRLARLRDEEHRLSGEITKATEARDKAAAAEQQAAAEARAANAPAIRTTLERKKQVDDRIDELIRALGDAVAESDELAKELHRLTGRDGSRFAQRMRDPRPLHQALAHAGLLRRLEISSVNVKAAPYGEVAESMRAQIAAVADRLEAAVEDREAA